MTDQTYRRLQLVAAVLAGMILGATLLLGWLLWGMTIATQPYPR